MNGSMFDVRCSMFGVLQGVSRPLDGMRFSLSLGRGPG